MFIKPHKKPEMIPREMQIGSTWYVLVIWGYWPSEQVGGFPTEQEAQKWIDQESGGWLESRFHEPPFV